MAVAVKFCGAKLAVAANPAVVKDKSEPVTPKETEVDAVNAVPELSVTLTDKVFSPITCGTKRALLLKGLVEKLAYSAVELDARKLAFDQI